MGEGEAGLTPSQRTRLEQLAARLVLGKGFYPEVVVRVASQLVAEGVDGDGLAQLASQPADSKALDGVEVERLFHTALAELGLQVPSREIAGWTVARWIATAIVDGVMPPDQGALRLWNVSGECGHPSELVEMLQLHDAWESSFGSERTTVEGEIQAFAHEVISAADRHLTARRPPTGLS
jgi:hypothetical protein